MSTQVQYRRGTATENNAFTGALAEITVDTTNWTLRVHDGATAGGGGNVATVAYVTAQLAALSANAITFGTSNVQIPSSGSNIRVNVGGTSNVAVFSTAGANVTGTLGVTGNITGGGYVGTVYTNSIINTGANATGNIGSSSLYFNTAFVKATSAQYADLAEMYVADRDYLPGTVVEFGGSFEITQTTRACSTAVAGIVSTNPSYLMNSAQPGEYVLPVALTGRVPCQVQGPVKKGDVLVSSSTPGVAQRIGVDWQPGCTVGKAMENINDPVIQTIEVAVGRL